MAPPPRVCGMLHRGDVLGVCMNHKRGRPKNARAGCLMCKPNKMNGAGSLKTLELGHKGFGKLRKENHARIDMKERN